MVAITGATALLKMNKMRKLRGYTMKHRYLTLTAMAALMFSANVFANASVTQTPAWAVAMCGQKQTVANVPAQEKPVKYYCNNSQKLSLKCKKASNKSKSFKCYFNHKTFDGVKFQKYRCEKEANATFSCQIKTCGCSKKSD